MMEWSEQQQPIETDRLILRPPEESDAGRIAAFAGDERVVRMTKRIPYPLSEEAARAWIRQTAVDFAEGREMTYAVTLAGAEGEGVIGCVGLVVNAEYARGELGYWVGYPYWGRGYCTEAAGAVLRKAFVGMGLRKAMAWHFKENPASGAVLRKLGFTLEGACPKHVLRFGEEIDLVLYGLHRDAFMERCNEEKNGR